MTNAPTKYDDVIDSRDVIERLDALRIKKAERGGGRLAAWLVENGEELAALEKLASEGADYAPDWEHGETMIRDSYFKEYAQELAEDIGAINSEAAWPARCIDWDQAARELQMDYSAIDFDGVTYWIR